jgi:hypothetical protein
LLASWGAFLVSLIVILTSHLASQKAHERQVEILEQLYVHQTDDECDPSGTFENGWTTVTRVLNLTCFAMFVVGVVAFSLFAVLDLPSQGG